MALTSPLQVYDTLARGVIPFRPSSKGKVTMYTCGPTLYASAHIGNLRTFVVSDWWRRTLEWNGYEVKSAMNVTDVDDKTIKGSKNAGISLADFTNQYEKTFFADLESLNIEWPEVVPHATEYIKNMIELVEFFTGQGFCLSS